MQRQTFKITFLFMVLLGFSAAVSAAGQYQVTKVESWDTLNMRAGAGVDNRVIDKLPHNAGGIQLTGNNKTVGKTNWVEIRWQGKVGWVSKTYLAAQANPAAPAQQSNTVELMAKPEEEKPASVPDSQPAVANKSVIKKKQSGMWILECGNASPYWKVEVLPEWMTGTLGDHVTGMPITNKRQIHGKYNNVAVETEVRGANKWNRLRMTLNYTKSCYSSLTKRKVAFSVKGTFNNKEISGCCRSLQVD